jgi:hypothetical protein
MCCGSASSTRSGPRLTNLPVAHSADCPVVHDQQFSGMKESHERHRSLDALTQRSAVLRHTSEVLNDGAAQLRKESAELRARAEAVRRQSRRKRTRGCHE